MAHVLIDLDNTLTKIEPIIEKMASVFNKEVKDADELKSYTIGTLLDLTKEQDKKFWDLYGYLVLENSEPNSIMIEKVFRKIVQEGDTTIVVTARPESQRDITINWLSKFGLFVDDVILVGKNSKVPLVENYNIDTIIDDNPALFDEIEVVKDLFPDSNISKLIKNNEMKRYVVDYGYNKDVVSEFRIDRKTGEITNGNQSK